MAKHGSHGPGRRGNGRVTPKGTTPPGTKARRTAAATRGPASQDPAASGRPTGLREDRRSARAPAPPVQRRTGTRGGR